MVSDAVNALFALVFVLALLVFFVWLAKRSGLVPGAVNTPMGSAKTLKIKETKALDARNRLVVASWNGTDYLLATGQNGVTRIDQQTESTLEAENSSTPNSTHEGGQS